MKMYKFNFLLLFLIFEFAYFVKSQQPEELYEEKIEEKDAEQSLHKIQPGETLPLVLFRNHYGRLFLPTNLHKVRSLHGKMIQGTEFTFTLKGIDQMFFCPKSDTEKCLVATTFNDIQALQCPSEPIPVIESENIECGNDKSGFSHKFVYQICEDQDEIYTEVIPFYRYCYDTNRQKTLFTVHTIQTPELLTAKLLLREREVTYPMIMNDGTTVSIERGPDGMEVYEPSTSKLSSPKPGYQWRKLVQTEDMALALWRKPTFHEMNLALQHKKLIKIWDNIGEYVRSNAIQSFTKNKLLTVVFTGVFDLKSEPEFKNDHQLSNIWIKLIMTTSSVITITSSAKQGVAILMNNFIDTETSHSTSSNVHGIESYCDQDICTESLKDQFKNVHGNVRCCMVTTKILDLFNHKHIQVEELPIPKVTIPKDQETLKDEQNDEKEEKPVESLREIKPNEILPIILYLNRRRGDFDLYIPKKIEQIETKHKRIVNGSEFFRKGIENQLLFCRKEDSNETCLVPRKFGRFEPLQCTKLPVPVVKQVLTSDGQKIECGDSGKGTLYKVVYEICTDTDTPPYENELAPMKFYKFCYDSTKQTILYTYHELMSPKLLNSKLLFWERKVEFPMSTDTQLPLSNLEELLDAIKEYYYLPLCIYLNPELNNIKLILGAEQSLHKIQPGEALPLVLFRNRFKRLFLPMNLHKVTSLNGKMIPGTEFTFDTKFAIQMFFCPKSDTEKCLVATTFNDIQALQCPSEPIPVIESENIECHGNGKSGFSHKFVYQICEDEDEIDTKVIPSFYRYCYDTNRQKTLFTVHTIRSPELLTAKLLLREREVTYPMTMNDGTTVSIERGPDGMEVYEPSTSKLSSPKPGYQWRKLVQTEDMALALWRKPTFYEMNLALQHKKLIDIWDNIGEYVRSNAKQTFKKYKHHTVVYTGVVDLKSEFEIKNDDQLSNIWVKLIMTSHLKTGDTSRAEQGVAILMNNFIDTETSHSTSSNVHGIESYCDQDICTESLKDQFKNVHGNVRCCLVTTKILDVFNHKHIQVKELPIPKVTIAEDQETLKDQQNDEKEEKPVESLREIKPNEILPIILYLNRRRDNFDLYIPKKIEQIETKHKRIVNGSEFFRKDIENQLLYCPKEDSNDTCLVPRKFGRFEPLQCTKLPVPVVKQVLTSDSQKIECGDSGKGTLYKVGYKICTDTPPYKNEVGHMKFYKFCYDSTKQTILYTYHELMSPKLLNSKLLFWERKVEFPMSTDTQLPLSNLEELLDAIKEKNESSTSPTDKKELVYRLQKLVPSEDMAFGSWKIPTNLLVNVAFQHESLISFWDGINRNVKDYIKTFNSVVSIYNGVLDIPRPTTSLGADQKSQMWFKIIQANQLYRADLGIVILMQNFLILQRDPSIPSNYEENTFKQYCEKNLCLNEFQNKFKEIGGQVRCCRLTTKIAQTFGIPNVGKDNEVLSIPDIISRIGDEP